MSRSETFVITFATLNVIANACINYQNNLLGAIKDEFQRMKIHNYAVMIGSFVCYCVECANYPICIMMKNNKKYKMYIKMLPYLFLKNIKQATKYLTYALRVTSSRCAPPILPRPTCSCSVLCLLLFQLSGGYVRARGKWLTACS